MSAPETPPVLILFALPEESSELRRELGQPETTGRGVDRQVRGLVGGVPLVVAHTGVGPERAGRQAREMMSALQPRLVVSAGFAGGLQPGMPVGTVIFDARASAVPAPAGARAGKMVSAGHVLEAAAEKQALGRKTGALAVDMESAAIAGAAEEAGVPMVVLRVLSDVAESDLPVPMRDWFDTAQQRPRPFALVWYLVRNPGRIAPFARFVSGLAPARRALAKALMEMVKER